MLCALQLNIQQPQICIGSWQLSVSQDCTMNITQYTSIWFIAQLTLHHLSLHSFNICSTYYLQPCHSLCTVAFENLKRGPGDIFQVYTFILSCFIRLEYNDVNEHTGLCYEYNNIVYRQMTIAGLCYPSRCYIQWYYEEQSTTESKLQWPLFTLTVWRLNKRTCHTKVCTHWAPDE